MVWLNLSAPTTPLQTPYEQLFKVIASWLVTGLNWRLISGFYASKPLPLRCPKIRYFDLFKLIVRNDCQILPITGDALKAMGNPYVLGCK